MRGELLAGLASQYVMINWTCVYLLVGYCKHALSLDFKTNSLYK